MIRIPAFEELLALVEDRSAALRDTVAGSPDLRIKVPSCPDWSLRDLVGHLAQVQRFWAAAVLAGPGDEPPNVEAHQTEPPDLTPSDEVLSASLLAYSAKATRELTSALRTAGPTAACWTWWGDSGVPMTSGAVARHQVHEAAVHAFDAQLATGTPQPIPAVVAIDGIAEFISVSHGTAGPWPHEPAWIGLHAAEGHSWLLDLMASGAPAIGGPFETAAELYGSASDLLLALHGRLPLDSLRSEGDLVTLENLLRWPSRA